MAITSITASQSTLAPRNSMCTALLCWAVRPASSSRDVDSDLAFSPDGKRMAYMRGNDPEPGKYRLLTANLDGSDETILQISQPTRGSYPQQLAWSPDGKQIAYSFTFQRNGDRIHRKLRSSEQKSQHAGCIRKQQHFRIEVAARRPVAACDVFQQATPGTGADRIAVDRRKVQPVTRDTNRYATLTSRPTAIAPPRCR